MSFPPGIPDTEANKLLDDCEIKHLRFIDAYYQGQPSAEEAHTRYFQPFRAKIVTCLEKVAGTIPATATRIDILNKAHDAGTPGQTCLNEAGFVED